MTIKRFMAVIVALYAVATAAKAATIDYQPNGYWQTVAANDLERNNVWTGVGQSFTAEDMYVQFGFYMLNNNGGMGGSDLIFTIYAGDGDFSMPLISKTASVPVNASSNFPALVSVDFSSVELLSGAKYTVVLTQAAGGLAPNSYAATGILYSGLSSSNPNPYAGGSFYYFGSSYPASWFLDRDVAFRVTPVPEPASWILLSAGILVLILGQRRRRARTAD